MITNVTAETEVSYGEAVKFQPESRSEKTSSPAAKSVFSSFQFGEVSAKTDHIIEEGSRISFNLVPRAKRIADTATSPTSAKKEVDAVITAVEDVSIICEILLDTGNVDIRLPKALFPKQPFYGMPISITLDDSSGYTVPKVTLRTIPDKSQESNVAKVTELIDSL